MDRGSRVRRVRDRTADSQRYSMIYSTNTSGYYEQPFYSQALPMFYTTPESDVRTLQVNRRRSLRNQTLLMTNRYRRSLQPQPSLRTRSLHSFRDMDGDLGANEGDGGAVSDGQRERMGTSEHTSLPELGDVNGEDKTAVDMAAEYEEHFRDGRKYRTTASIMLHSEAPAPPQHLTSFSDRISCTDSTKRHSYLAPPINPVGLLQTVRNTQAYWYLNSIPPTEVRQRLETQPIGSFIVRQSNRWADLFRLIFKSGPRTADIKRVDLRRTRNGFSIDNCSEGQYYPTMYHLIAAHCRQMTALPCLLRLPGYTTFSQRPQPFNSVQWSPKTQYTSDVRLSRLLSTSQQSSSSPVSERGRASYRRASSTQWRSGPENDSQIHETNRHAQSAASLLPQGAACQLFYIGSYEITARNYMEAIKLCVDYVLGSGGSAVSLRLINFRVCGGGIIMNDLNKHQLFQQHYPAYTLLYIGLDPLNRKWKAKGDRYEGLMNSRIFGFISRNPSDGSGPLQCHLLAENSQSEPAHVICDFTSRYFNFNKV